MAVPFDHWKGPLPNQRRAGAQASPGPKVGDRLAPAKGILVGLASSTLFWIAARLAYLL